MKTPFRSAFAFVLVLHVVAVAGARAQMLIDKSQIDVIATENRIDFPPAHTNDGDLSTFWHGTNNISFGQTDILAFRFQLPHAISRIDVFNDIQDDYNMGELEAQVSPDSTNGLDGAWQTIFSMAGNSNPPSGDFTINVNVNTGLTPWIRFRMTYQGRGAFGNSPAFYVSEVDFYGTPLDSDNDSVAGDDDLCSDTATNDPVDDDGCSDTQVDTDDDGVCNPGAPGVGPSGCSGSDVCSGTVIPESVPTVRLGTNRWALVTDDHEFDTTRPRGGGPGLSYDTTSTCGCSCEQIIEAQGLGKGHTKFGCSINAMNDWVASCAN